MNFHDFLESKYVETNLSLQDNFNVYDHAKTIATGDLLKVHRGLFTAINYVQLLGQFALVKLHIIKAPRKATEVIEQSKLVAKAQQQSPVNQGPVAASKPVLSIVPTSEGDATGVSHV